VDTFRAAFPDGLVIHAGGVAPSELARLPYADRRDVWRDAERFVLDLPERKAPTRFDVSAYGVGGSIDLIFLVARSVSPDRRREWRLHVRARSYADTLAAALAGPVRRRRSKLRSWRAV
jgi:hypothetical protein